MNEEITGVKPPMGFPHITDLSGSEATILQVANSQGDILGYATLDDIDAYIEQKVSETVHSFSQKQIFQDVTINGTFDGNSVVNVDKLNGALGSYYNKQSVDTMLNNLPQKTIVNPTTTLGDIIESSNIERIDFFGKKMYRGSITFKENTSTQTLFFTIQGVSANKKNVGTWSAGVLQQGIISNTSNANLWLSDAMNNVRIKVSDLSGKKIYFNLFEVE